MAIEIVGHAVVSADGRIADRNRQMPAALRNDKDWVRFQAALDRAQLTVLGRLGHEAHANPGRRRLVLTTRVQRLEPIDELVTLWNPAGVDFRDVATELGITDGVVAVVGHEPGISALLAHLIGGAADNLPFKKGGAALVAMDGAGAGRLVWFLPPRVLRAVGGD